MAETTNGNRDRSRAISAEPLAPFSRRATGSPPPPLPPLRPLDVMTEQVDQLLHRARSKTEVASWIPKPLRGLFRRQGSYNRVILDTIGALIGTNAQLGDRVRALTEGLESQHRWLRQSGGMPAMQEIESLHLQIERLREQSNWLGREVNSLREALEANAAAGTRAVDRLEEALEVSAAAATRELSGLREAFKIVGSLDLDFIKATLLQHGSILQSFVDDARERHAKFDAAQAGIQQRLDAVGSLTQQVEQISSHFAAAPYLSDPDILRTTDDDGRDAIGYRANGTSRDAAQTYIAFENIFRGPEDLIRKRQRTYVGDLRGHEPVVDLGCGRGEMLDLLQEANIAASGVDSDAGMVRHTTSKGHRVEQMDVIEYLTAQPDGSAGAFFSAQVIEHLSFDHLLQFLTLALRKLKPGGVLIAETVNPHSHRALKTFYVDLTHNKPIFPEVLVALCRQFGYAEAIVRFPCGEGTFERDRLSEGEYAVIARTPAVAPAPA